MVPLINTNICSCFIFNFLPQLLLGFFSTVDVRSKSSLMSMLTQPMLLLLPVFTMFTFSIIKFGSKKIAFSEKMTLVNMMVTLFGQVMFSLYYIALYGESYKYVSLISVLVWLPGALFTSLFLYFEHIFGWCCDCWKYSGEKQKSVFDTQTGASSLK